MNIFDYIKQNIDLLTILDRDGYSVNTKSTKKNVLLENSNTGDKLLVFDKDSKGKSYGHWIYQNVQIKEDKGDILTYIRNRLNGIISVDYSSAATYKAINMLKPYFDINEQFKPVVLKKSITKEKLKKELIESDFNTRPIDNFNFLYQRGIHTSTLEHKDFKGKIFNSFYFNKFNHLITNTAFAKTVKANESNSKDVQGYEIRNHDSRQVKNDKEISQIYLPYKSVALNDAALFFTNIPKPDKPITHVFFAESAIDILAYHEILRSNKDNYDMNENNHLFVSFGGNIYERKLEILTQSLERININHNKTKFVSITDNDTQGYYYDLSLLTTLINKYKTPVKLIVSDTVYYKIEFSTIPNNATELNSKINSQNKIIENSMTPEDATNIYGKFILLKENKENSTTTIFIPIQQSSIQSSIQLISEIFNSTNLYIAHKPDEPGIDWNDKLLIKKKLKTAPIIKKERIHIKRIQKEIKQRKEDKKKTKPLNETTKTKKIRR